VRLSRRSRLILLAVLAAGTSYFYFGLLLPQVRAVRTARHLYGPYSYGGDFYPVWLSSRELLASRHTPYNQETTRQIQVAVFGRALDPHNPNDPPPDYRAFSYPLYVDLLAAPCALLSFPAVQTVGSFLGPLLAVGSIVLWFYAVGIAARGGLLAIVVVLTLISYPVLEALYALQPALAVSFLLAAGMAALRSGKFAFAGVLLALAAIKPQLIVLLALALLLWSLRDWKSRKGFAAGFAGTLLVLVVSSYAVLPGWPADWWRALVEYRQYTEPPLAQLVLGKFAGGFAALLLLALAARVCWLARRETAQSSGFWLAVTIVLAVAVVLVPTGGAVYDHLVLLPGILWLFCPGADHGTHALGPIRWLGWLVLSWQWVAAAGVAVAALLWANLRHNQFAILLPLRTAAALPFVILAMLFLAALNPGANRRTQPSPDAG